MFKLKRTTFVYWPIECTPRAWFVRVFQLEKTTFIYWPIECTSKALFIWLSQLEKIPSSIDQLKVFWKLYL
jgi:hypothetical protein